MNTRKLFVVFVAVCCVLLPLTGIAGAAPNIPGPCGGQPSKPMFVQWMLLDVHLLVPDPYLQWVVTAHVLIVTDGPAPVPDATVSLLATLPDGSQVTFSGVTDGTGVATASYTTRVQGYHVVAVTGAAKLCYVYQSQRNHQSSSGIYVGR